MTRTRIVLAALTTGLLAWGGVAMARTGTPAASLETSADTTVYSVADAGTVTVGFDGSTVTLVDHRPAEGWSATVDAMTATEIEIDFVSADQHLRFKAEVEDGDLRAEVEDRTRVRLEPGRQDSGRIDDSDSRVAADDSVDSRSAGSASIDDSNRSGSDSGSSHHGDRSGSNSGPGGGDGRSETHTELMPGVQTITVAGHGTITVEVAGNVVSFIAAEGTDGWSARLDEADGREVEVVFQKDGAVVEAKLEIEDGRLRLRVELKG